MNKIFFSIIIPLMNKEKTIKITLQSVMQQKFENYEIIIVDDGSTDKSETITKSFFKKNDISNYTYIKQSNLGVSSARNKGAELSKGKYICFLDADDIWLDNHLFELSKLANKYKQPGFLISRNIKDTVSEYNQIVKFKNRKNSKELYKYKGKSAWIYLLDHSVIHTSAIAVEKETFYMAGKFIIGAKKSQDVSLWLRVLKISDAAVCAKSTSIKNLLDDGFLNRKSSVPYFILEYLTDIKNCYKNQPLWIKLFLLKLSVINIVIHNKCDQKDVSQKILELYKPLKIQWLVLFVFFKAMIK